MNKFKKLLVFIFLFGFCSFISMPIRTTRAESYTAIDYGVESNGDSEPTYAYQFYLISFDDIRNRFDEDWFIEIDNNFYIFVNTELYRSGKAVDWLITNTGYLGLTYDDEVELKFANNQWYYYNDDWDDGSAILIMCESSLSEYLYFDAFKVSYNTAKSWVDINFSGLFNSIDAESGGIPFEDALNIIINDRFEYGLWTTAEYNAYGASQLEIGRTQGINHVLNNLSEYNLYTAEEYNSVLETYYKPLKMANSFLNYEFLPNFKFSYLFIFGIGATLLRLILRGVLH